MAKQLEFWNCNLEAPVSIPALTASWICSQCPEFVFSATHVNSQLVHLLPDYFKYYFVSVLINNWVTPIKPI